MQSHILPKEDMAGIYRFAVLLAGAPEPAQAAMLEAFADAGEKIHHFRTGKSCKAWLVAKVRNRLMKKSGEKITGTVQEKAVVSLKPEAVEFVDRFSKIPEPGRSALALLYIEHFTPQEITQILQISMDQLPDAVEAARSVLRQMDAVQKTAATGEAPQP